MALCASINTKQIIWLLTNPRQIEQPKVAEDHSLCRVVADIRQIEGAGCVLSRIPDGLRHRWLTALLEYWAIGQVAHP